MLYRYLLKINNQTWRHEIMPDHASSIFVCQLQFIKAKCWSRITCHDSWSNDRLSIVHYNNGYRFLTPLPSLALVCPVDSIFNFLEKNLKKLQSFHIKIGKEEATKTKWLSDDSASHAAYKGSSGIEHLFVWKSG